MRERVERGEAKDGVLLAVLTGDTEMDAATLEALRVLDPGLRTAASTEEALAAIRDAPAALVVLDAGNPSVDPVAFRKAAGSGGGGANPILLTILPAGSREAPDLDHFLVRPFQPETLSALVRLLLQKRPEVPPGKDGAPSIQLRRPARFSARPLYGDAVSYGRESFERARATGAAPEIEGARIAAERIHTSLLQSNQLLLRALEPYEIFELPNHCANVAIFSAKIAIALDRPLPETLQVVQAGLLHDIGMMLLPDRILRKEGPLSAAEREEMQRHPVLGAEILAGLGPEFEWLRRAVAQEHERLRGQGYPKGLAGDDIDPMARIIGVADVFEAYSQARAYRSPFGAFEALEKVSALRDDQFDPEVVDALTDQIAVFPPDSYVLLSTGEIGRVVDGNPDNLLRPTVEILWDESWSSLDEPRTVDLGSESGLSVVRPLHEADVPIT